MRELAAVSLKNPVRIFLNQSTDVATHLDQEFIRIRPHRECDREAILAALLVRTFPRRTIVFLPTKKDCHRMHVTLGLIGVKCAELHGDMNQAQRLEALRRFTDADALKEKMDSIPSSQIGSSSMPPPVDVLLATDLASRGLDIPGVQTVSSFSHSHMNKFLVFIYADISMAWMFCKILPTDRGVPIATLAVHFWWSVRCEIILCEIINFR